MPKWAISNLWAASGKTYEVRPGEMQPGALQYVDRDYVFSRMPDWLHGLTRILTAGDDKMYEERERCFSFETNRAVKVFVLHANKIEPKPIWLHEFENTGAQVWRSDSDEALNKGIFTIFAREFPPGLVALGGCLPSGMLTPAFRATGGATYCMYSVVVGLSD